MRKVRGPRHMVKTSFVSKIYQPLGLVILIGLIMLLIKPEPLLHQAMITPQEIFVEKKSEGLKDFSLYLNQDLIASPHEGSTPFFETTQITVVPAPEPEPEPQPLPDPVPVVEAPPVVLPKEVPVQEPKKVQSAPIQKPASPLPASPRTADSVIHEIIDPTGVPWAYDCKGVGTGILALAIWEPDGSIHICIRSNITLKQAPYVATHELQHVFQYRVMAANNMTLTSAEAHLAQFYGTEGMNKTGGAYGRLEIAADCGTLTSLGTVGSNPYIYQCSDIQKNVATAFREGRVP